MPLTTETLDLWFVGHPPTDETRPLYAAIRDAEHALHTEVFNAVYVAGGRVIASYGTDLDALHEAARTVTAAELFDRVNASARAFAIAIDASAPESADKTAAIRCVRLARNAANEAVVAACAEQAGMPVRVWASAQSLLNVAHAEIVKARWQANSAIAISYASVPAPSLVVVVEVPAADATLEIVDPHPDAELLALPGVGIVLPTEPATARSKNRRR